METLAYHDGMHRVAAAAPIPTMRHAMGFMVAEPLELLNWRALAIDENVPLEEQPACPCCGESLVEFARLVGSDDHRVIRVGACDACGYLGYLDRPAQEWISRYYADTWSHGTEKDVGELQAKKQKPNPARSAIERALGLLTDKAATVLEIGSGYGTMLKFIRDAGCPNVIGVESSRRRARAATNATALPILTGDFESLEIQSELKRRAPIRLLYAFHVLEHTYHPGAILATAAKLQEPGDLLVLGVPSVWGEPAMNILLFLPHLHSFSASALTHLLNRSGYEVVDSSFSNQTEIVLIARRTAMPVAPKTSAHDFGPKLTAKFRRELCLDKPLESGRSHRYFWSKDTATVFGLEPYHWYWRFTDRRRGHRGLRSLRIAPLNPEKHSGSSPLTLFFPGQLSLWVK